MELKSNIKTKGVHILTLCKGTSDAAQQLQHWIEHVRLKREVAKRGGFATPKLMHELWEEYRGYVERLEKLFKVQEYIIENITTTEGRTAIADVVAGVGTYTGAVTHTALGTSNAAPAVGDTQLGTETYRKALTSGTKLNNVAYLETFFTASEVTGTFEEYGNFIDGTGAANSGQILNRFIQTITKSGVETLNVQSQITFADA